MSKLVSEAYDEFAHIYDAEQGWLEESYLRFIQRLEIHSQDTVIEVGCGTGILGKLLAEISRNYVGFDISMEMLKVFKEKFTTNRKAPPRFVLCDAAMTWPTNTSVDWVFFSVNTIRNIVPAQKQTKMLAEIGSNHLHPKGSIIIMFSNYFKWQVEQTPNLHYNGQLSAGSGSVWKVESKYELIDLEEREVLCRFYCTSSDGKQICFAYPLTWQPLGFYLSALKQIGFVSEVYGSFEKMPYSEAESEFAIIEAVWRD
jgi:SAM-dependent methyltransferase